MRFDKGMLGLTITMAAIMGTVLAGFALGVETSERDVTGFNYVTDVSGLFDYSEEREFIEYNPASNWTGYYTNALGSSEFAGVSYTQSSAANNYALPQDPIRSDYTFTPGSMNLSQVSFTSEEHGIVYDKSGSVLENFDDMTTVYDPSVATVQTFVNAMNIAYMDRVVIDVGTSTATSPVFSYVGLTSDGESIVTRSPAYVPGFYVDGATIWRTYTLNYYPDAERWDHIVYYYASSTATVFDSDGNNVWSGSASELVISYGGSSSNDRRTLTDSVSVTAEKDVQSIYLNPGPGVSPEAGVNVRWSNSELNGTIDILVRLPSSSGSSSISYMLPLCNERGYMLLDSGRASFPNYFQYCVVVDVVQTSGDVSVTMSLNSYRYTFSSTQDDYFDTLRSVPYTEQTISIGQWRNFVLSLDTRAGSFSVVPVTNFASFQDYNALTTSFTFGDITDYSTIPDTGTTFRQMVINTPTSGVLMGVNRTEVFLNTYGVVMVNPELDIRDYFNNLEDLRLNFTSFALYGDSITINGQTFDVSGATIEIEQTDAEGNPVTTTYELTNLYVTFDGGRTSMTFVNAGQTVDLGETTTTNIAFGGVWYFATALYEGYATTEDVYSFDFKTYIFDNNASMVFFMGTLILGTAIASRMWTVGVADFLVVGIAGAVAFVMMVV